MGSDEFISLDHHQAAEDGEIEQGKQDMDLESDSSQERPIIEERTTLIESVVILETPKEVHPDMAPDNGCVLAESYSAANNILIGERPIAGVKRARLTYVDQQPCVRVVFNSLTRESKKKLMELMQQWSEWHAQCKSSTNASSNEGLECGEETYFPALHVGSEKTSTVTFWVDNQARNDDIKIVQLDNDSVPLYDRGYTLGSTSLGSADSERMDTLEDSRCFNCGSYSHSLKECTKPRDNAAINSARNQHNTKRSLAPASRGHVRYYRKPKGKFDDLRAGVLGSETRECLGIGEFDPPPWLHRMRELGYPPGYLDVVENEDEPSGITIFGEEEPKVEYEDGELPEKGDLVPPEKKMTVEFPGINAPIPENADQCRWATTPSSSSRNRTQHRPNWSLDPLGAHRGHYYDRQRDEGLPGTEYGSSSGLGSAVHGAHRGHCHDRHKDEGPPGTEYALNSGLGLSGHRGHYHDRQRDEGPPGTEQRLSSGSAVHGYSPRYSPYEHSSSPRLGRSFSDRGWQSPATNEVPSPRSPYPNPNPTGPWQLPAHQYPGQAGNERQEHHHRRCHNRN